MNATAAEFPLSLKTTPRLDRWVRFDANGRVSVYSGKVELGQGIETAIAQIAYKHVARLAENFLKEGDCGVFNDDAMQYSQLQNLFEGRE